MPISQSCCIAQNLPTHPSISSVLSSNNSWPIPCNCLHGHVVEPHETFGIWKFRLLFMQHHCPRPLLLQTWVNTRSWSRLPSSSPIHDTLRLLLLWFPEFNAKCFCIPKLLKYVTKLIIRGVNDSNSWSTSTFLISHKINQVRRSKIEGKIDELCKLICGSCQDAEKCWMIVQWSFTWQPCLYHYFLSCETSQWSLMPIQQMSSRIIFATMEEVEF